MHTNTKKCLNTAPVNLTDMAREPYTPKIEVTVQLYFYIEVYLADSLSADRVASCRFYINTFKPFQFDYYCLNDIYHFEAIPVRPLLSKRNHPINGTLQYNKVFYSEYIEKWNGQRTIDRYIKVNLYSQQIQFNTDHNNNNNNNNNINNSRYYTTHFAC